MSDTGIRSPFELLHTVEQRIREAAAPLPEGEESPGSWKGITFRLNQWHLVARQGMVREILVPPRTTRVPGTHPWVIGVANVHGEALPVVDLADFFWGERLPPDPANRILLVCQGSLECGLLVSEVLGIRHFRQQDEWTDPHPYPAELGDYLLGSLQQDGVVWGEFSMEALMESPGFIDLSLG